MADFDEYSSKYQTVLNQALSITGEDSSYYGGERVRQLQAALTRLGIAPQRILDFGCGSGRGTVFLSRIHGMKSLLGIDVSAKSIAAARDMNDEKAQFMTCSEFTGSEDADLIFCNGVFHHIAPDERLQWLKFLFKSCKTFGLLSFWENNPWNLGTRLVMSKCEFDYDAIPLAIPEAKRLLQMAGFTPLVLQTAFYFPHSLRALRRLEPLLASVPLGGQYHLLCRKVG